MTRKPNALSAAWDGLRAYAGGPHALRCRQRVRLADMVTHARAASPFYKALYRDLPDRVDSPALLPVTDKRTLMARFDDWVTDRGVTLESAQAFADNPDRVGDRFQSRYTVATTSATTGRRGVFLLDDQTMAVTAAIAFRMLSSWLDFGDLVRIVARGGRMSMVMATGGHFASAVAAARLARRRGRRVQVLSVHTPLPELVAALNRYQPAVITPYASIAAMLANEQEAGRLRIHPVLLALSAEGLQTSEYARIRRAFAAKVGNSYAATECTFLSYSCVEGWLHVNSDWVAFEAVDVNHRPVEPGTPSHTILISNLANRVQPILRYDLGDSVVERPSPCPCGNPLPAIRVQGRSAEVLTFRTEDARSVAIAPLAFGVTLDGVAGVEIAQIQQTQPDVLRLRLLLREGADAPRTWSAACDRVERMLAEHRLDRVQVQRAPEPPLQSSGGKFRAVIPLYEVGDD